PNCMKAAPAFMQQHPNICSLLRDTLSGLIKTSTGRLLLAWLVAPLQHTFLGRLRFWSARRHGVLNLAREPWEIFAVRWRRGLRRIHCVSEQKSYSPVNRETKRHLTLLFAEKARAFGKACLSDRLLELFLEQLRRRAKIEAERFGFGTRICPLFL
ncbi:MAG TPA: hypothetical protein VHB50_09955, partial [Bryobacteraceae bacterium]|nr:hypothetical protein [Bryobacteraceae bacterium]